MFKLTIKARDRRRFGVFIVNFEHIFYFFSWFSQVEFE